MTLSLLLGNAIGAPGEEPGAVTPIVGGFVYGPLILRANGMAWFNEVTP